MSTTTKSSYTNSSDYSQEGEDAFSFYFKTIFGKKFSTFLSSSLGIDKRNTTESKLTRIIRITLMFFTGIVDLLFISVNLFENVYFEASVGNLWPFDPVIINLIIMFSVIEIIFFLNLIFIRKSESFESYSYFVVLILMFEEIDFAHIWYNSGILGSIIPALTGIIVVAALFTFDHYFPKLVIVVIYVFNSLFLLIGDFIMFPVHIIGAMQIFEDVITYNYMVFSSYLNIFLPIFFLIIFYSLRVVSEKKILKKKVSLVYKHLEVRLILKKAEIPGLSSGGK